MEILTEKICSRCKLPKSVGEFHTSITQPDGFQSYCKECSNANMVSWVHAKGVGYKRNKHYKRRYGITLDQYNDMATRQHELCAICGNPETGVNKHGPMRLVVDHDHLTGKVRDLLCYNCNIALGRLQEGIPVLHSMIRYLTKWGV